MSQNMLVEAAFLASTFFPIEFLETWVNQKE
jgi:hypothetical protein